MKNLKQFATEEIGDIFRSNSEQNTRKKALDANLDQIFV